MKYKRSRTISLQKWAQTEYPCICKPFVGHKRRLESRVNKVCRWQNWSINGHFIDGPVKIHLYANLNGVMFAIIYAQLREIYSYSMHLPYMWWTRVFSGHDGFMFNLGTFLSSNTLFCDGIHFIIVKSLVKYMIPGNIIEMAWNLRQIRNKTNSNDLISSAFLCAEMQSNTFYAFVPNGFQSLKAFAQQRCRYTNIEFHICDSRNFISILLFLLIHFQIGNLSTFSKSQQCKNRTEEKTSSKILRKKKYATQKWWESRHHLNALERRPIIWFDARSMFTAWIYLHA